MCSSSGLVNLVPLDNGNVGNKVSGFREKKTDATFFSA